MAMIVCAYSWTIGAINAAAITEENFFFGVQAGARASSRIGHGGLTLMSGR